MSKKKPHKRALNAEERAKRRGAERDRMRTAIEELKTSEGWRRWLRARAAFRSYSFRNQILISFQCPEATHVAGYRAWQKIGYQVRRGELGIYIWARCNPTKEKLERWRREGADPDRKPRPFYRMVKVFDRSQVDPIPDHPGGPLPLEPPPSVPIDGDGLAHVFEPLVALARSSGYGVLVTEIKGRTEAFCNHAKRLIGVRAVTADFSANRQIARLVHEIAHMLVKLADLQRELDLSYGEEEVLVECVAALVCSGAGLDVTDSSAPYIAGWGDGQEIERYAAQIDCIASVIEEAFAGAEDPDYGQPGKVEPDLALVA